MEKKKIVATEEFAYVETKRCIAHFNIAGFSHYDGCQVFSKLKIGTALRLVRDKENMHDADAVAIFYKNVKLGYIPASQNKMYADFLDMGYSYAFELLVQRCDPTAHPEQQITVALYLKKAN